MNWREEWKKLALIVGVFLVFFWLPVGGDRFDGAVLEAFHLAKWYARGHGGHTYAIDNRASAGSELSMA